MASQRETLDPEAGVAFVRVPLPTSAQVPSEQHCPEATPDNISSPADHHGSSVADAIFNFTNSIVGAGAIGLGGAIAISGGAISIALILFFGILTKLSLDLVIRLSITTPGAHGSYEDLAQVGLGTSGRILVMACKLFYSFGCLVAYIIVVKDNFAHGLQHLLYGDEVTNNGSYLDSILQSEAWTTWVLASTVILPLCLLRDMTPLASLSVVSVFSMVAIVAIIVYMFFAHPEIRQPGGSTYEKWFEIRPGVLESLGTFVFTYVSQHTVHLVFDSLKPNLKTISNWKKISASALSIASVLSLSVGIFVYMTFWQATESDIFQIYPGLWQIDVAKLLLCVTMLLTFPLPFFTCRELLVVTFVHPFCKEELGVEEEEDEQLENDLQEPLLAPDQQEDTISNADADTSIVSEISRVVQLAATPKHWLMPDDNRQLVLVGHVIVTVKLWIVITCLAIAAPSLGDVLDLVGCATGTIIAFILPALLSFSIEGYSHLALLILLVGGAVGTVGTFFSLKKLFFDLHLTA